MARQDAEKKALKLFGHKDFALMYVLKEMLSFDGYYSDLGMFCSEEDYLYLTYFFKVEGCGNTIYKLNICVKNDSLEDGCSFIVGFDKNNHEDFSEDKDLFERIKGQITVKLVGECDESKKKILLGICAASDLSDLVKTILENYGLKKVVPADVSRGDFITMTEAKEIIEKKLMK